jgi:hypothetical protein
MPVRVQCPNPECGKIYRVDEARLGQTATCKQCGRTFTLEALETDTSDPLARDATGPELPAAVDPSIPKELGRFKIRSRLGSGAFGTVYRAHDPVLDREVAMKVPRAAALEKPEARARFLREPKAAAQLRHPNIVPVYDAGVDGDRYYMAPEQADGSLGEVGAGQRSVQPRCGVVRASDRADALRRPPNGASIQRDQPAARGPANR